MITKAYSKNGKTCRVTFTITNGGGFDSAYLCGDFTEWEKTCLPMKQHKDGRYVASVSLNTGQAYRFRYLLNDMRWENDEAADGYVPNPYGSDDSVVNV